ncbi:hypothetical protein RclHR1_15640007 [Rhizophagus clarus]|uniref:Uncharacterized protein n=1 Tax=Rhizophagus clarus TaxID=94130 RepID=A0A2Z6QT65_9GLOM|nr:hypothetical protein RclHR1_15640007 [Rhizophagus clarus]
MRELLLVRKLQEENAKKNKISENITSENSNTSIKSHHGTADSSANIITINTTDITNQTFNREVQSENTKSHDIDNNVKIIALDDKINPTHELNTSDVDKISEQVRSERTSTNDSNSNRYMGEISFNEKTENSQNLQTAEENAPVISEHDGNDLIDPMSEEEKKHNEAVSLALRTKRESLKEFFLQKQPYIHKDTFTDNQIVIDSNFTDDKKSVALTNVEDEPTKEKSKDENPTQGSSETTSSDDITITDKPLTSPPANLSPDEKRQRAAANRNMQRKDLKKFLKQRKLQMDQMEQKSDETTDTIIMGSEEVRKSSETKNVEENSDKNSTLNGLNGDDKIESDTTSKDEINNPIHIKQSKNKTSYEDIDSDGSIDLDAIIANGSDLESGEIQLTDDGLDDGDENFWSVDSAELERHITPSTSPLPPDLLSTPILISMIAEEDENLSDTPLEVDGQEADDINENGFDMGSKEAEYEDDEINEIDMSLDTQITPIIKPVSPSPVPSPYPTLSGGKSGIPAGLPKTAFSAHFGPSPLSPTSSRASSVGDPDEYETMSNGSYTSVRSTGSAKSGASGIRRPSTVTGLRSPSRVGSHVTSPSRIATPGRVDSHSSTSTPQRSRSMSVVSDSSTEESTTSSVGAISPSRIASPTRGLHMSMYNMTQSMTSGTRPRSMSRVSNSSTDDVLARSSASHIATPRVRPLSRAGSQIGTPKSSNISAGSQSRIRNSVPQSNVNSTKSKYAESQLHTPTSNSELAKRPLSRAGIAKPSSTSTTSVRPLSRLASLSEPSKTSALKKPRPQSIAVGNTSTNNTAKIAQSNIATPNSNSGIRSPSVLRTPNYGGRHSTDSLSSHDEYSASSMIFTPPESPTGASETDSLTSLTSSVSYGSSPGRGTSPIPPHNTSMLATPTRLSKPGARTSVSKLPASRIVVPSKLATPSGQPVSGLRKPKMTKE